MRTQGWRRVGTAVVRWPLPILIAACGIALVGLLTLPGYKTSYNDRLYIPQDLPANWDTPPPIGTSPKPG